jgi:hypothetical protein
MATYRFISPDGTTEKAEFKTDLDALTYASEYSDTAAITTVQKEVDGRLLVWDREKENWTQAGAVFSLLCWQPKITQFASCKAENVEKAIEIFRNDLPSLHLTSSGCSRKGTVSWTVARNPNPFL